MTSDRWEEVERIYHEALEREAGQRAAFLKDACGSDDALKRDVSSLLEHEAAAGAFLEKPALENEAKRFLREPRVGPRDIDGYEILSLVGEGGMGEVYRARDLTLGREVAIKVLARSAAGDLRRFDEEARLASALNHPNIVTIYGVGEKPDFAYIAMELVRGRTLRALLAADRVTVKRALDLAVQLADALAAAHAIGIIHRDLKPENLMVTPEGLLKVLDFGIAKLQGPALPGAGAAGRGFQTEDGRILGTVGYMSPEQAAGKPASHASDQFALGTILYEMVTGERAWKRDTAAETLAAIIREDPPPIASASPGAPPALRWIVDRCLAKDPDERYASTRDLARDLATLRDHLGEVSGGAPAETVGRARPKPRRARAYLVGVLVLAAVAAGILLAPLLRKPKLPDWTQVGFRRGIVWAGSFAPDGQTIVYSAAWDGDAQQIFSTRPGSTETRTLDLPSGKLLSVSTKSELAFLRDTRFESFFYQPGILARAGLEGGVPRDILENVQAADWSPDGTQLAVARAVEGRFRLEYPIGKTLYEGDRAISNVRMSRDGAWVAFCEGGGEVSVEAVRVADGVRRVLSEGWFPSAVGLAWSADGREIWFTPQKQVRDSSPALMAVTLSGKLREVVRGPGQLRLFDIAPDGRVLLARWDLQVGVRGSSPSTGQERELSATDDSLPSDLSSDGRKVLLYDRNALFLRATDGSPPLRLGEDFGGARLSPDGKWVLTTSPVPVLVPVGAGDVRRIGTTECDGAEWFPDGKRILCEISNPTGRFRLLAIELASGAATEIPVPAEVPADFDAGGLLSPDGAFLAGASNAGDILILPLAGGAFRRIAAQGTYPVGWTADSRHLFVQHVGQVPGKVEKLDVSTGRTEPWRDLTLQDPAGIARIWPVMVAADGASWVYGYVRVLSNLYVVEGLK